MLANAGIQNLLKSWIPVNGGMTVKANSGLFFSLSINLNTHMQIGSSYNNS